MYRFLELPSLDAERIAHVASRVRRPVPNDAGHVVRLYSRGTRRLRGTERLGRVTRRDLMALIAGSTIAWPLAARAQQPIPAIGWLSGTFPESEQDLPLP